MEYFKNIEYESYFFPSLFRGYIEGANEHYLPLAIAVNNKIQITTETFKFDNWKNPFMVLLPKNVLQPGRNDVRVYLIESNEEGFLLRSVNEKFIDVILNKTNDNNKTLLFGDNKKVKVEDLQDSLRGFLDGVTIEEKMIVFIGWAAELTGGGPASKIFIFRGERLVWQASPDYDRNDVAEAFNKSSLLRCGYRVSVPLDHFDLISGDISLFALFGDNMAIRIHIKDDYKELINSMLKK